MRNLPLEPALAATTPGNRALPNYQKMPMSKEYIEGPRAFAEKREPVWQGK